MNLNLLSHRFPGAYPSSGPREIPFPVQFAECIASVLRGISPQFMMTPTGGPDNTTMPLVMYLYEQGFTGEWKLSYAAAVAYILTIIILTLTLLQNRLLGRRVEYGN